MPTSNGLCPRSSDNGKEVALYHSIEKAFIKHNLKCYFWNFKIETRNIQWSYIDLMRVIKNHNKKETIKINFIISSLVFMFIFLMCTCIFRYRTKKRYFTKQNLTYHTLDHNL